MSIPCSSPSGTCSSRWLAARASHQPRLGRGSTCSRPRARGRDALLRIVAEVTGQPVAALVSFQRRCCVELGRGGDTEAEQRVRVLLLRKRSLELRPSLLPGALPKRRLPSFERRVFDSSPFRVSRVGPREGAHVISDRSGSANLSPARGGRAGPDVSGLARRQRATARSRLRQPCSRVELVNAEDEQRAPRHCVGGYVTAIRYSSPLTMVGRCVVQVVRRDASTSPMPAARTP